MHSSKLMLTCLFVLSTMFLADHAHAQSIRIVTLGDSNTAGYGVDREAAFPALLETMLRMRGVNGQVSNAGISGDTTQGMLNRLDTAVPQGTQVVILQGGYNDLRRGGSPAAIAANMDAILSRLRARQVRAVLCGFYDEPWSAIARRNNAVFVPWRLL
jgi:acyl-CoA thioesterase I